MKLVFTICSNNYLAQATTLGKSLLFHNPDYLFKIGLVDKRSENVDYSQIPFEIIEVDKIDIAGFNEMALKYDISELNTAVKPFYFQYFFKQSEFISIIYLDPDIQVYAAFSELEKELKINDIIITPHFTSPIKDDKLPAENTILSAGVYNLGFIAIKSTNNSNKMLNWWAERLYSKAFIDFKRGLFTDQIWINFVPLFFENVNILKHPGYNMAYWNLHERSLEYSGKEYYVNDKYPLVFFHFSGYDPLKPEVLSKYQDRYSFVTRKDVVDLFKGYANELLKNEFSHYNQYTCFYANVKTNAELAAYIAFKKSIPVYKKILRGIILRIIKAFKLYIDFNKKPQV